MQGEENLSQLVINEVKEVNEAREKAERRERRGEFGFLKRLQGWKC